MIAVMDFRAWRVAHKVTLLKAARALGFDGQNPARTLHRIESGEAAADADLAADIARYTRGEVTGNDLQAARLHYLEKNGKRRRAPGGRAPRVRPRSSNAIGGAIS